MGRLVPALLLAGLVGLGAWFAVNPRVGVIVAVVALVAMLPLVRGSGDDADLP